MSSEQTQAILRQPAQRLEFYDRLLVSRVVRGLQGMMPVTSSCLASEFELAARKFARQHDVELPTLRDLAPPFLASLARFWRDEPDLWPGGWELAKYECLRVETAAEMDGFEPPGSHSASDGRFSLLRAARFLSCHAPVHRWYEEERLGTPGPDELYFLLLYRRSDLTLGCLELSNLASRLLKGLTLLHLPFSVALQQACDAVGTKPSERTLDEVAILLKGLIGQGVLAWDGSLNRVSDE